MNWYEQYKEDFGFKTNYQVKKMTGITASSLQRLDTSKDWNSVQFGTIRKLAKAAGKSLDEFYTYLAKYEEEKEMDKLTEIFNKYGINTDWLDELEETGKVNLGELDNLDIISDINNETEYTADYSNDFDGGVVIEK